MRFFGYTGCGFALGIPGGQHESTRLFLFFGVPFFAGGGGFNVRGGGWIPFFLWFQRKPKFEKKKININIIFRGVPTKRTRPHVP